MGLEGLSLADGSCAVIQQKKRVVFAWEYLMKYQNIWWFSSLPLDCALLVHWSTSGWRCEWLADLHPMGFKHLSGSSRSSHKDGNLTDVVMWCLIVTLPVFVGTGKPRSHQCAATSGKQRMDDLQQSLQSDDETMTCKNVCLHKASSYSCWISKRLMAAALFPSKPMMEVANSKCPGRSFIIWRLFWTWWIHVIAVSLWVCNKIVGPLHHVSISWTDIISLSFWVLLAPLLDAFEAARIETSFPNIKDSLQLQISIQAVHHTSPPIPLKNDPKVFPI